MIIEISMAVIALAFVILVIYLIALIKTIKLTLKETRLIALDLKSSFHGLEDDAKKIIDHAHDLSLNLFKKMEALDPLFKTISNTGDYLEHKSACLAQAEKSSKSDESFYVNTTKFRSSELAKFAEIVELIGVSIRLWQKFKGE